MPSPDNIGMAAYEQKRARERASPEYQQLVADLQQQIAAEQGPQGAASSAQGGPAGNPKQASAAGPDGRPQSPEKKEDKDYGFWKEARLAVVGGARDAAQNSLDLLADSLDWVSDNVIDLRRHSPYFLETNIKEKHGLSMQIAGAPRINRPKLPEVEANQHAAGKISRAVTQFVIPYTGALKMLGTVGGAAKVASAGRAMVAGAAADFAAFDPHEKRLSNLMVDAEDAWGIPLRNSFTEYLAANSNDGNFEGRFKNMLEGAGLGLAVEGAWKAMKAGKAFYTSKYGDNASKQFDRAVAEAQAEKAAQGAATPPPAAATPSTPPSGTMTKTPDGTTRIQANGSADAVVPPPAAPANPLAEKIRAARDAARRDMDTGGIPPKNEGPLPVTTREASANPDPIKASAEAAAAVDDAVARMQSRHASAARRPWLDPVDGTVHVDATRPAGTIDLDTKVKAALEAPPVQRTAEDLIALRAARQMQEAAFPGIATARTSNGPAIDEMARASLRAELEAAAKRPAGQVISDADRAAIRAEANPSYTAPATARAGADARAIREAAQEEAQAILDNAAKIAEVAKQSKHGSIILSQGGFASPTLLANIASGAGGAAVGLSAAPDDASFAERLAYAGMGALAGVRVKVGGKAVFDHVAARRAAASADEAFVKSMARPEMEGIAPKAAAQGPSGGAAKGSAKGSPSVSIPSSKVDEMVRAFQEERIEDLAQHVDESGFNLKNIDGDDDIKSIYDAFSVAFKDEIDAARGGDYQSHATVEGLAHEINADAGMLKELLSSTGDLAPRLLAARMMVRAGAGEVKRLSRLAADSPGDVAAVLALRKQIAVQAALVAHVKGAETNAARALSALRIQATTPALAADEMDALLNALGGRGVNLELAGKLGLISDPAIINRVAEKVGINSKPSKLYEAWINGILSGMKTFTTNIVGNSLTAVGLTAERGLASVIGNARRGAADFLNLKYKDEAISAQELVASLHGMTEGVLDVLRINSAGRGEIWDASRAFARGDVKEAERIIAESSNLGNFYKSWATDDAVLDPALSGATRQEHAPAITAEGFGLTEGTVMGNMADVLGAVVRTPGRLLQSSDEIFKGMLFQGEKRALAVRQALSEGKSGDEMAKRVSDLLENTPDDMIEAAFDAARRGTFSNPLGSTMQAAQNFITKVPFGRWVIPFVKTPANIIGFAAERTPVLNVLSKRWRDDIAAGGIRRDQAFARTAMGGGLILLASQLKSNGMLTGGGDKQQQAERTGGQQQYSIKVGDKLFSINRLDPMIGILFGMTADIMDISGQVDEKTAGNLAGALSLAVQRNITSKSYVKGVSDVLMVLNSTESYGEKFVQRFVASALVPSAVAQFVPESDPTVKEAWSVVDAIKSRLPGYSKDVPPAVNVLGEDVRFADGWGPDIASPVRTQTLSQNPLAQEILRLNVDLKHPPRTIKVDDSDQRGIDLTPWQYHRMMKIAGSTFTQAAQPMIESAGWKAAPEIDESAQGQFKSLKALQIAHLWERSKQAAKFQLLQEDKSLMDKYQLQLTNSARAKAGLELFPINK